MELTITQSPKLADAPAYKAAQAKLSDLRQTESRLKTEIDEIEGRLKQDPDDARQGARKALLAGANYADLLQGKVELTAKLVRLREELVVVQGAVSEQQQVVDNAGTIASREICESIKSEHDALLGSMVRSVHAAHQFAFALSNLRDRLDADGISISSLPVIGFPGLGREAVDSCSRLAYLVREALDLGIVQRSDITGGWLTRWEI
jgi:hypothetical protein